MKQKLPFQFCLISNFIFFCLFFYFVSTEKSYKLFPSNSPDQSVVNNNENKLSSVDKLVCESHFILVKSIFKHLLEKLSTTNQAEIYFQIKKSLEIDDERLFNDYLLNKNGNLAEINSRIMFYLQHLTNISDPFPIDNNNNTKQYLSTYYYSSSIDWELLLPLLLFLCIAIFIVTKLQGCFAIFALLIILVAYLNYNHELFSHYAEQTSFAEQEEPFQCRPRNTWSYQELLWALFSDDETLRRACSTHKHAQQMRSAPTPHGKIVLKSITNTISSFVGDTMKNFVTIYTQGLSTFSMVIHLIILTVCVNAIVTYAIQRRQHHDNIVHAIHPPPPHQHHHHPAAIDNHNDQRMPVPQQQQQQQPQMNNFRSPRSLHNPRSPRAVLAYRFNYHPQRVHRRRRFN